MRFADKHEEGSAVLLCVCQGQYDAGREPQGFDVIAVHDDVLMWRRGYNIWSAVSGYNRSEMSEGKNGTQLIDKTTRNRIFNSRYWKEECFALNAETFIDKAVLLKCIGGLYGGAKKPTKFLCLLFKMLQMGLSEDIVLVYLGEKEYKYLNALALLYLRLTTKPPRVFEILEPFYVDNRKLRVRNSIGRYELTYVDQLVDDLLINETCLGLSLPFIPRRLQLELQGVLDARRSLIEEELNMQMEGIKEEAGEQEGAGDQEE